MIKTSISRGALTFGALLLSVGAAQAQVSAKLAIAPAAAKVGKPVTFNMKVTSVKAGKGIPDVQVFDAKRKQVFQGFKENETFPAGKAKAYSFKWTPKAKGVYQVKTGVFEPGWKKLSHWNNDAGKVTVK
ncbi:MAG TPA: hypothetical protein VF627_14650 [Abditibacterium sp.]|jgi:hypothetical protein